MKNVKLFFKSRSIQAALIGLVGVALVIFFSYRNQPTKSDSTPTETQIYYFAPDMSYDQSLSTSTLPVATCWVQSLSSSRSDAFRCEDNNEIFDPCFTDPINDVLTCPQGGPYGSNKYLYIDPFKLPPVDRESSTSAESGVPWFIKLNDGTSCTFITGATYGVANMRYDYGCDSDIYTGLFLPIKKEGDIQKISCYAGATKISSCAIKEVWY